MFAATYSMASWSRTAGLDHGANLIGDIFDDVKDFIDDEIVDRGRDTERDLRKAARKWTESDHRGSRRGRDDMADLHEAVTALSAKVDALAGKK